MTNLNNVNDAPNFSLKDLVIDAKVISVYDGDTIKCIFLLKVNFIVELQIIWHRHSGNKN